MTYNRQRRPRFDEGTPSRASVCGPSCVSHRISRVVKKGLRRQAIAVRAPCGLERRARTQLHHTGIPRWGAVRSTTIEGPRAPRTTFHPTAAAIPATAPGIPVRLLHRRNES